MGDRLKTPKTDPDPTPPSCGDPAAPEDLLDALLEAIPDFVYFKDARRRFVRFSRPFTALFGRPRDEIVGRRDEDLFPPEVAAVSVPDDEAVLRGEAIVDRIEGGDLPSGERWVSTTKVPWRDADGRIVGVLGISRDITASKRRVDAMQREAQRSLRLETLGRLAGGVAHDFNNLLTVILGAAEEMRASEVDRSGAGELVDMVVDAAEQARGLTRQLLRFSRQEPGQRRPLRVDRALREHRDILARLMPDDVELIVTCSPAPPVPIDPVRLQQVVLNLALNARDAMADGGRLTIEVAPELRFDQPGVTMSVADTGSGLPPELRAMMFEPFYSTKPDGLGTGLGLTLVGEIVDEVDGEIDVESEPGQGTTFRVWFPCAAFDDVTGETAPPMARPRSGSVLLVDDDPAVRRVVARMMTRMGYRVVGVGDLDDATGAADREAFDLLVTDVILRSGTGLDVAAAIRRRQPELPVIYISGFTDDLFERRGVAPADLDLLPKPFTEAELMRRIDRALMKGG